MPQTKGQIGFSPLSVGTAEAAGRRPLAFIASRLPAGREEARRLSEPFPLQSPPTRRSGRTPALPYPPSRQGDHGTADAGPQGLCPAIAVWSVLPAGSRQSDKRTLRGWTEPRNPIERTHRKQGGAAKACAPSLGPGTSWRSWPRCTRDFSRPNRLFARRLHRTFPVICGNSFGEEPELQ